MTLPVDARSIDAPPANRHRAAILLAASLGLSSYLLFVIQPLIGRLVLPLLGGTAAVWTTCLLFFQAMLLAGYAWAHAQSRLPPRVQAAAHVLVLAVALATLPLALRAGWYPPAETLPAFWLVGLLAVSCGVPVFALASNAPTLQRWYAGSGGREPYVLYAVSNAGSLLGLLSYPLVWETTMTLTAQRRLWTAGYVAVAVLVGACAFRTRPTGRDLEPSAATPAPRARQVARWVALAATPASLVAGVTAHITTDLAPVPLLWIVPLVLYLLTYVTSFAGRPLTMASLAVRLYPVAALAIVTWDVSRGAPSWVLLPLHLGSFTLLAALCHGRLASERPAPDHLTAFYLWVAVGGVLGGSLNAIVAPLLFRAPIEYPLMLIAATVLLIAREPGSTIYLTRWLPIAAATVWGVLAHTPNATVALAVPALALAQPSIRRPALRLAAALVVVVLIARIALADRRQVSHPVRSFFAALRIIEDFRPGVRALVHGATVHGMQATAPDARRTALSYYAREGPIGQAIAALGERLDGARIGIVGLGVGELAVYARPGQDWTAFEIDPVVARIAADAQWFTYLTDARAPVHVVLGDGRLSLDRAPAPFSLLVIDAFSSDVVPTHLLTREAMAVYLRRLEPGGVLAFHVSNRYADLEPVVGALAADARLDAIARFDQGASAAASPVGRMPSRWIAVARRGYLPEGLDLKRGWHRVDVRPTVEPWSDERSSIAQILSWR